MKSQNSSKVKKHKDRPDLTGEHPFGDLGQLIFLIIFLLVWIADIFIFKFNESEFINIPGWIKFPVGISILVLGFYLAKKSMKMVFGTKKDHPEIINNNIYEKVRHPMYLGSLLFYLGVTILMCSFPLLITFMIIFIFYNFIARYEEKLLIKQFGNDYIQYKKRVRRWIPKLLNMI